MGTTTCVPEITDAAVHLTLIRTGEFSVRFTEDNRNQCGPSHTTDILRYRVEICMTGDCLDEQGFMVDNGFVAAYFRNKYRNIDIFESCEKIAILAVRDMYKALCPRAVAVKVEISGFPEAILRASYIHPEVRKDDVTQAGVVL